jgi:hypothetical protein
MVCAEAQIVHFELVLKVVSTSKGGDGFLGLKQEALEVST